MSPDQESVGTTVHSEITRASTRHRHHAMYTCTNISRLRRNCPHINIIILLITGLVAALNETTYNTPFTMRHSRPTGKATKNVNIQHQTHASSTTRARCTIPMRKTPDASHTPQPQRGQQVTCSNFRLLTWAYIAYSWLETFQWSSRVIPSPMADFISRDKDGSTLIGGKISFVCSCLSR